MLKLVLTRIARIHGRMAPLKCLPGLNLPGILPCRLFSSVTVYI